MNRMFEFLQENNGNLSTARLIPAIISCAVIFKYIWQTITTGNAAFTAEEITLVLGSFGIKVGQKVIENKTPAEIKT